jgi:hypothetical protein
MSNKTVVTVSGILADLENGLTRTTTSKNYKPEIGCIQDKYELNEFNMSKLFKHPKLKGKKTKVNRKEITFDLVDDTDDEGNVVAGTDLGNLNPNPEITPEEGAALVSEGQEAPTVEVKSNLWED